MSLANNSPSQGYPEDGRSNPAETSDQNPQLDDGNSPTNNNPSRPSSRISRQNLQIRYGPELCREVRRYEKTSIKLAKEMNHITFLHKARDNNVIPKGFKVKLPIRGRRAERISTRASQAIMRERLNHHRYNKTRLLQQCEDMRNKIREQTNGEDFESIMEAVKKSFERTNRYQKEQQKKKLDKLIREQRPYTPVDSTKTVINLSSKTLDEHQIGILNKGLKFAIAPNHVPRIDMLMAVEETASRMENQEHAEEYRWKVRTLLDKSAHRKPNRNITRTEYRALEELKTDETIKILPADKGNATVIMDVDTYDTKIEEVLQAGKYKRLTKDPTNSMDNKVYRTLYEYRNQFPDQQMRSRLTPHFSKPPHLYGLPKIHKPEIPLRPIVSSRCSPCHPLAKYLLDIISPLVGHTQSMVKNTEHFVSLMRNQQIQRDDLMVSFDISSLFTNVPTEQALSIVKNRLREDRTLQQRTTLSINAIMEMLTLCIRTTYFQIKNDFYQQEFGLAMGSPLSPAIANIYMENFEERAMESYHMKPNLWVRYVDDTFVIWPHGRDTIDGFLQHLNNIEETIKFTMELEENGKIAFLDVQVQKEDGIPNTTVYRKPTNTGQYLHFDSNHHINTKLGVAQCLYDRARTICLRVSDQETEFNQITETLKSNGYPRKILERAQQPRIHNETNNEENKPTTVIPYVRGLSENIRRVGNRYNIRTAFKTQETIRSKLTKVKPKNENQATKNCIYEIPCECGRQYIGETKRPLRVRIEEHKKLTRLGETEKSKIAQHVWEEQHHMQWDQASIIAKEDRWTRRKLKEAAFIATTTNPISTPSLEIKNIWMPIIRKDLNRNIRSEQEIEDEHQTT